MWLSGQPGATKTWLLSAVPQPALLLVASRRAAAGKVRIISDTEQQEAEQGRASLALRHKHQLRYSCLRRTRR